MLDVTLVPTPATVDTLTNKAADGRKSLSLVGTWIPLACIIFGLIALFVAIRLLREPEAALETGTENPRSIELPEPRTTDLTGNVNEVPNPRPSATSESAEKTQP